MSETRTEFVSQATGATQQQDQESQQYRDCPRVNQRNDNVQAREETISALDSPTRNSPGNTPASPILAGNELMSSPVRVPGTFPPEWLPDDQTDACMACESAFTLIKRRHHCRSCGKIFCSQCCRQRARLLYMDNKEERVCNDCHNLIAYTLTISGFNEPTRSQVDEHQQQLAHSHALLSRATFSDGPSTSSHGIYPARPNSSAILKVQGVLKTTDQLARTSGTTNDLCNVSNSSSSDQHSNKQVIFSDGIRPGTDLSEPFPYPRSSSSSNDNATTGGVPSASAQSGTHDPNSGPSTSGSSGGPTQTSIILSASENHKHTRRKSAKNITVCDELGYLPPIVISKESPIANDSQADQMNTASGSLASLIMNQFKGSKKTIQASMESRSCPLNGVVKFEEISGLVGVNGVVTFLLLKNFYLKAKLVKKLCCVDRNWSQSGGSLVNQAEEQTNLNSLLEELAANENHKIPDEHEGPPQYWCFTSSGLDKLGQDEIMFVLDRDKGNSCIPRDIFKIYLTLHELALRRQAVENLGNLLFQDGLFGSRDTAGLLFIQPSRDHCLQNLVLPDKKFLIALVLQRWEVPWAKIFPMRLLLRLGHKYDVYPYPIVSYKSREPVYYEIGHTIISILGDFRNFRYSLTHVEGLRVMLDKTTKKVIVQLHQSNYMQFSKVLDSSNNEHVLAWSACPFYETDGHLVSVQNDDGQYETIEFFRNSMAESISFNSLEAGPILGASFIVFSGALKFNQSGQPAKIRIVEDGILIQMQSCTMSALRNAIHYMENFDIDCENAQDALNRFEIRWLAKET